MSISDILTIVSLIVTITLGLMVYKQNKSLEFIKSNLEKENFQYKVNNEIFADFIKSYHEHYLTLNNLTEKYKTTDNIFSKLNIEEKQIYNKGIANLNVTLGHLYISAPDDIYQNLADNWNNGKIKYAELGFKLLQIMRLMNYPNTRFGKDSDIKFYYYGK